MHPVIMEQLAADHIRQMHAKAHDEHRARQARRRAPATPPAPSASGTLSHDDPRLDPRQQLATTEQPSPPPPPVMASSPPDSGDAITRREALDHCH
jgi:hypothetical protein